MTEKRYGTNDIVKFDYSEIWRKSDDEMYTDTPLRNNEVVELLNENEQLKNINGIHRSALLDSEYDIKKLEEENELLKEKIYKLCNFIEDKINETEEDLKRAVKAGMSTTLSYSDLDLLEEIRKKLRE